jgi:hypothetical protein
VLPGTFRKTCSISSMEIYLVPVQLCAILRQAQDERNVRNSPKKAAYAEPGRSMRGLFCCILNGNYLETMKQNRSIGDTIS